MSNFDSNVYVDTLALNDWKTKINKINTDSAKKIIDIKEKMKDIDLCMAGNIAEGIKYDMEKITKYALQYHTSMKDVEKILQEIVITRSNE